MNFKTSIIDIKKEQFSFTEIMCWIGVIILSITLLVTTVFDFYNHEKFQFILNKLLAVGFTLFLFPFIFQFFDIERIKHTLNGTIQLTKKGIILNESELIPYDKITELEISNLVYYKQLINTNHRYPKEKKSLGVKNYIQFKYNSRNQKIHFKLQRKSHLIQF